MNSLIKFSLCLVVAGSLAAQAPAETCEQLAEQYVKKIGKSADSKDGVLWALEEGAAWRCAGQFEKSNKAFDLAEERIDHFDEQAKIKVSDTAKTTILGPSSLNYEGHAYDKIMMNTFKALNYIQLGQYDKARVELNRALERQREAVELNAARLEKAKETAAKQDHQVDADKIQGDEQFQSGMKKEYADMDGMKFYADYVNPMAVYLDGLFFMTQATGSSDYERARKSFERVLAMSGENPFIKQDIENVALAQAGQLNGPLTYIIFEAGKAPARQETHLNTPAYLAATKAVTGVPNASVAFPKLGFQIQTAVPLSVTANGTNETAVLLASLDSVVAQEFKNVWPMVLTQTLSAYFARGVAGGAAKKSGGFGCIGGALAGVGVDLWLKSVNHADLRAWNSLPKEFYYCRIPTPEDRKIELSVNGGPKTTVTVDDGQINLVCVKAISPSTPLVVSQGKLR